MPRTPTFPLFDRLLDGRLREILRELRDAGLNAPDIRDTLRDNYQVSVSVPTVRRWLAKLHDDEREEAAS